MVRERTQRSTGKILIMKIVVHAKPGARKNEVEKVDDEEYVVSVKKPPVQGRANRAIIELLAEYFGVSKSSVSLITGKTSRIKIFQIQ